MACLANIWGKNTVIFLQKLADLESKIEWFMGSKTGRKYIPNAQRTFLFCNIQRSTNLSYLLSFGHPSDGLGLSIAFFTALFQSPLMMRLSGFGPRCF